MEHREARADLVGEREQVELGPEPSVIALGRLLQLVQVLLEVGVTRPRRSVDALQHRIALVAPPVGAGDPRQLEVPEPVGVGHVGPAAEVDEARLAPAALTSLGFS